MSALDDIYKKPYLERTRLEQCITQAFFSDEHMHWRDEAAAQLAAQQTALDAWKQALQSLTPGGSEFTEPHECANYLRTRDAERWELLKKMKIKRDAQQTALDAAREVVADFELGNDTSKAISKLAAKLDGAS